MSDELDCAQVSEAAPELVLGALDGGHRAAVLSHLLRCPACRGDVAELADVVDNLGWLAAPVTPSPGFEDRVLGAIGLAEPGERPSATPAAAEAPAAVPGGPKDGRARRRPPKRWTVLAVAAAFVLLLGLVAFLGRPSADDDTEVTHAAMVTASNTTVGSAYVIDSAEPLVVVSVGYALPRQTYTLEAVAADGTTTVLGDMRWQADGTYTWGGPVPSTAGQLTGLRMVAPDGTVTCHAVL